MRNAGQTHVCFMSCDQPNGMVLHICFRMHGYGLPAAWVSPSYYCTHFIGVLIVSRDIVCNLVKTTLLPVTIISIAKVQGLRPPCASWDVLVLVGLNHYRVLGVCRMQAVEAAL